jgi:hypothetical protein
MALQPGCNDTIAVMDADGAARAAALLAELI